MLRARSPSAWIEAVLADMDAFLLDHAACERKASGMAMSMLCHYPDRVRLVREMTDLAVEEMQHFKQVMQHIAKRQLILPPDTKDFYVINLRNHCRKTADEYFLDRLLVASIIEARGAERFQLVADHTPDAELKLFYQAIARSEERHYELFLHLAEDYFQPAEIEPRLSDLLDIEAKLLNELPSRAALH